MRSRPYFKQLSLSLLSGSSNVLEALGYQFTNDNDILKRQLDKTNLCFLHAPLFHPAMKAVGPIRRQLGVKTFFNMLGPMVNPSFPKYQMVGVFSLELARLYQYIFQQTEKQYAIVHALDGYDEISLTGNAKVKTNNWEKVLSPQQFGKEQLTPESLFGGETVAEAAKIFVNVLNDEATASQKDAVAVNSGLAIHCINPEKSLQDCVAEATASIESGKAFKQFSTLMSLN